MNNLDPRARRRLPVLAAVISVVLAGSATPAAAQPETTNQGVALYKKGGCMACHKWHGMGGSGYGGTPINMRETILDRDELIEVIACGRPGTAMPAYHKRAYRGYDCYDGLSEKDLADSMPGRPMVPLARRQIIYLADFILEHFKGRSNEVEEADCRIFFGDSKMCRYLDIAVGASAGGGRH